MSIAFKIKERRINQNYTRRNVNDYREMSKRKIM